MTSAIAMLKTKFGLHADSPRFAEWDSDRGESAPGGTLYGVDKLQIRQFSYWTPEERVDAIVKKIKEFEAPYFKSVVFYYRLMGLSSIMVGTIPYYKDTAIKIHTEISMRHPPDMRVPKPLISKPDGFKRLWLEESNLRELVGPSDATCVIFNTLNVEILTPGPTFPKATMGFFHGCHPKAMEVWATPERFPNLFVIFHLLYDIEDKSVPKRFRPLQWRVVDADPDFWYGEYAGVSITEEEYHRQGRDYI